MSKEGRKMIVKSDGGYQVKSESGGKNLSKPGLSKAKAVKRLKQVEFFKHKITSNASAAYKK